MNAFSLFALLILKAGAPATVTWKAPEGCGTTVELAEQLTNSNGLVARGFISNEKEAFRLELDAERAPQKPWRWTFQSAQCRELFDAARVVLQMYLEGRTVQTEHSQEIKAMPKAVPQGTKGFAIAAAVTGFVGVHPAFSVGPSVMASVLLGKTRLSLSGGYASRSNLLFDSVEISVASLPIQIHAAYLFELGRFELGPAVNATGLIMFALSRGLTENKNATAFLLGFGAGAVATVKIIGPLKIVGRADFGGTPVRPQFLVENSALRFTPAPVYGSFTLGLELFWK